MVLPSQWFEHTVAAGCEKMFTPYENSIVNAQPKVVGFLRVLRFPPAGKVDRVG